MTINQKLGLVFVCLLLLFHYGKNTPNIDHIHEPINKPVIVEPKKELSLEEVLNTINESNIKKNIEILSSKELCGRGTGTNGAIMANKLIQEQLAQLKIPYSVQNFKARGLDAHNVIGYIESTKNKNDIIVIGAHYDHLGGNNERFFPGADDNASGVAGVLEIAKALSLYKDQLNKTISIQFYSAEEMGLIGSSFYCKNPLLPLNGPDINKHIAMVNLDMIGYLKNKYGEHDNCTTWKLDKEYKTFNNYRLTLDLKETVKNLSNKYPFATNISGYRPGGSDHAPFYNQGVPVIFLHTGLHPYYHKPTDTPDKLNYTGIKNIAKLATEIILQIDKN